MPVFVFTAKIPGGKVVKGEVSANSETEARVKIRAQSLVPVSIGVKGAKKAGGASILKGKISGKELQIFTRQFATLINSGIPVVQGLQILSDGSRNPVIKNTLGKIKEDISSGKRLAESMQMFPNIFDKLYVNLVRAGEEGGILDTILNRLAVYIEKAEKIRSKIKGAMFYPVGVLCVAVLVIVIILTFVIPKFEELFKNAGKELPALTQMVVNCSHFMIDYWYVLIAFVIVLVWTVKSYYATEAGKLQMDELFIRMPVIGGVIQKGEMARFARTLSTMLSSGVPLLDSLDIAAESVGNAVMIKTLRDCRVVVQEGKSLTIPLQKNPYVPDMVVQMVGVGEQTGAMDNMLGKIADFYEEEVDYAITSAMSLIEPIMLVFLGGIVAVLVIAMYLPIFGLAGAV